MDVIRVRKHLFTSVICVSVLLFTTGGFTEVTMELSNTTVDSVIYADILVSDEIEANVEFGVLAEEVGTEEEGLAFDAMKGVGEIQEVQRIERDAAKLARLTYNPFEKSNLTAQQYDNILKGTGLQGTGKSYAAMEKQYNVNGMFAIAIALHESGLGKYKANTNNFYGMRSSKGWMAFKSPHDNIMYFGYLMNKDLYKGKSLDRIAKIYCPPTYQSWANQIRWYMSEYFEKR